MSKKTVLFVDDELNVLEGLRTRLHRQRSKWEMVFVQSGREALERLAQGDVDVLVTDMRMPEMDGVTLLKRAQEEYPRVVRIVLSGHAELEAALRAIHVAHQFLSKPCEAGVIENVVERAVLLADGNTVSVSDLQIGEHASTASATDHATAVKIPPTGIPLEEIERQAVVEALRMSNWVQKDAAELLGISPRVMNYKIKILNIEIPRSRRVLVEAVTT